MWVGGLCSEEETWRSLPPSRPGEEGVSGDNLFSPVGPYGLMPSLICEFLPRFRRFCLLRYSTYLV